MCQLVIGAGAELILAMFQFDHFWLANALYVGFVMSSLTGSVARLIGYRRGLVGV